MKDFTFDEYVELSKDWDAKKRRMFLLDHIFDRWDTGQLDEDEAFNLAFELQDVKRVKQIDIMDKAHHRGVSPSEVIEKRAIYMGKRDRHEEQSKYFDPQEKLSNKII